MDNEPVWDTAGVTELESELTKMMMDVAQMEFKDE